MGCRKKTPLAGLIASYPYASAPVREAILALKFRGITLYAPALAKGIAAFVESQTPPLPVFDPDKTLLVPVPLAPRRFRERGFNQAEVIARHLGARLRLPVAAYALGRTRETTPQTTLADARTRRENVARAFSVNEPEAVRRKTILLVDDVYTTGATMAECAKTLHDAGSRDVWGVAIAKG